MSPAAAPEEGKRSACVAGLSFSIRVKMLRTKYYMAQFPTCETFFSPRNGLEQGNLTFSPHAAFIPAANNNFGLTSL